MQNSKLGFYNSLWAKYMPVIRILLKKSVVEDQVLNINRSDLERAGGARKTGYRFNINFINSRPDIIYTGNDLIQSFISVLIDDKNIQPYLSSNDYTFTLTSKYQLHIKNTKIVAEVPVPVLEEEQAE